MREPIEIEGLPLPVRLKKRQQELWDSGPEGQEKVRAELLEELKAVQHTPEQVESLEKAPTYNEVMGEDA